jgi:GTP pyrophosphokinase
MSSHMTAGAASDPSWSEQYRRAFSVYESCAKKLGLLIEDLLQEAGIDVVEVESRAKNPDSLVRKVEGKKDKYPQPLSDVMDLVGVRVIAYYLEDVERIEEIVQREFVVDEKNSSDKLDELEPDRFGYRSIHYIVSLSKARSQLAEWGLFDGKLAEIQLRTATQHAWAAVEHKLSYRRAREAPRDLRRRLMRLSALFELADEQFSVVRNRLEGVEAQYSEDVKGGNLDLPIDKASIEAFIADNDLVKDLIKQAEASGFDLDSPDAEGYEDRFDADLRDLVEALDLMDINTIEEFNKELQAKGIRTAIEQLGAGPMTGALRWGSPADVLCTLILFGSKAPKDLVTSIYGPTIFDYFEAARE